MLIAFQIILFMVLLISVMGVVGEKENENLRNNMTALSIASIAAIVITFIWL